MKHIKTLNQLFENMDVLNPILDTLSKFGIDGLSTREIKTLCSYKKDYGNIPLQHALNKASSAITKKVTTRGFSSISDNEELFLKSSFPKFAYDKLKYFVITDPDASTLDNTLDKVSQHGIDSLTPDQKSYLDSQENGGDADLEKKLSTEEGSIFNSSSPSFRCQFIYGETDDQTDDQLTHYGTFLINGADKVDVVIHCDLDGSYIGYDYNLGHDDDSQLGMADQQRVSNMESFFHDKNTRIERFLVKDVIPYLPID